MSNEAALARREQMKNLMDEIRSDEATAMKEASVVFASEDMKTFLETLTSFRDRTVPGSSYDQILTYVLSVVGSVKALLDQNFSAEAVDETTPKTE